MQVMVLVVIGGNGSGDSDRGAISGGGGLERKSWGTGRDCLLQTFDWGKQC